MRATMQSREPAGKAKNIVVCDTMQLQIKTSTIAPVISSAAPVVETTLVASPTGLCGLVPYSGSDSDSPDEMSSLEHNSPPKVYRFLSLGL
ncbi:hypothetical protein Tco_1317170 [Tanacetum coccineum]